MSKGFVTLVKQFVLRTDSAGIAVPPMDGPLTPNEALSGAQVVCRIDSPRDLVVVGNRVLVATRSGVVEVDPATGSSIRVHSLPGQVGALCVENGEVLAAVIGVGIVSFRPGSDEHHVLVDLPLTCPTAIAARGSTVVLAEGSAQYGLDDWSADLMARGSTGSIRSISIETGEQHTLMTGIQWCSGVALVGDTVVYSEAWAHRLMSVPLAGGRARRLGAELPAYPGRIVPAASGGHWLAAFAARTHLVEFVLTQDAYRAEMVRTIPQEHWIRPSLAPSTSGLDPLQGGQLKKLGSTKPWAPARSYGLVARLDEKFQPVRSYHSRADSNVHGIVGVADIGDRLLVASAGLNALASLDLSEANNGVSA